MSLHWITQLAGFWEVQEVVCKLVVSTVSATFVAGICFGIFQGHYRLRHFFNKVSLVRNWERESSSSSESSGGINNTENELEVSESSEDQEGSLNHEKGALLAAVSDTPSEFPGSAGKGVSHKQKMEESMEQGEKTLEDFGYRFKEGRLCDIKDENKGFNFNYYKNRERDLKRYEDIGKIVDEFVYSRLESECNLDRLPVPFDGNLDWSDSTFIFASKDYEQQEKLILLIHGGGVVRAGQWARRLIINGNMDKGSQIPYIMSAKELGYGVIVLNTNDNDRNGKRIKSSKNPEQHAKYVWKTYISQAKARHIAIVAHRYGGSVTGALLNSFQEDFMERVFAVAFTDAFIGQIPPKYRNDFKKMARNWVTSYDDLGRKLYDSYSIIPCISAGTTVHEETSYRAINEVFAFFEERFNEVSRKKTETSKVTENAEEAQDSRVLHDMEYGSNIFADAGDPLISLNLKGDEASNEDRFNESVEGDCLVKLHRHSQEYKRVKGFFYESIQSSNVKILEIKRNRNFTQLVKYKEHRRHVSHKLKKSEQDVERMLWHGTTEAAVPKIAETFFNRSYAGENGTSYGKGAYFACDASYSDRNKYSRPNKAGEKYMFLARVVVGTYKQGCKKDKVAPETPSGETFDSVVDDVSNPSLFVVFEDAAAYPEYVIKYTKKVDGPDSDKCTIF